MSISQQNPPFLIRFYDFRFCDKDNLYTGCLENGGLTLIYALNNQLVSLEKIVLTLAGIRPTHLPFLFLVGMSLAKISLILEGI